MLESRHVLQYGTQYRINKFIYKKKDIQSLIIMKVINLYKIISNTPG